MRWILDACTLIYLVKAKLFNRFMEFTSEQVVIDTSVYNEVVVKGKENQYQDAHEAERLLNKYKIPVISIDISEEIERFCDPGETSCYLLAKERGICLTSDDKAYKKFISYNQKAVRTDTYFFNKVLQGIIDELEFLDILKRLELISATKAKSILFFMEQLKNLKEVKSND
ncbi:MAG: hypothetical protein ACTSQJ_03730 [Promethearchaeota archaeon]